ncbi:uncharacterized protein LOC131941856 [Physella acuta]|uniref:uncharacterized protein LOC131941856 n=1 Tax=Physella acuta TaxID=109671 RepID=UPI0027DD1B6A|nr:uncharacterized protein LOC131941856 [Physella acuta]
MIYLSDNIDFSNIKVGNDELRICTELLDKKIKNLKIFKQFDAFPLNIRALREVMMKTVMILSGTCLTLTLVTYAMFSELRSEAGKNNIMLCVSLLLATVIVMAKAYITQLGIICTTMGVASHFMWLWMLMWMFLGTFQMFKIFSASTRNMNSDPYQNHLLMRKLVISFLPPLVIVGAVIVKSLIESDGDVIGYGLNGCFIDSNSSVVMFLIAPVVMATVVNSGLFAATTYNIHKVRRIQASDFTQRTHGMFLVYVKLSTLTGITFVLDFIAFMLDSDVMW